jgi:hypothetical protein
MRYRKIKIERNRRQDKTMKILYRSLVYLINNSMYRVKSMWDKNIGIIATLGLENPNTNAIIIQT